MSDTYNPKAVKFHGDLAKLTDDELRDFWALVNLRQPSEPEQAETLTTWADIAGAFGPISWAWPRWLPNGFLTMLASQSGVGKSALALRIAACFLRGDPWPDGSKFTGETGAVLWCEAEAAQALNLERCKRWGLPAEKIYTPLPEGLEDFSLDNPDHLNALTVMAYNPDVKLIVIDSLSGAKPTIEKGPEEAAVVKTLAGIARDTGKPMIVTHHLRKRGMLDLDSVDLDRLRGSSAIIQPARVIWAIDTPDPYNKELKRFKVIKSNLDKFPEPVGLTIGDTLGFGMAPEEPRTETVTDKAADLLLSLLQAGPMAAQDIQAEYNAAGISVATINRAKSKLGIVSVKNRDGWKWALPAKDGGYEN